MTVASFSDFRRHQTRGILATVTAIAGTLTVAGCNTPPPPTTGITETAAGPSAANPNDLKDAKVAAEQFLSSVEKHDYPDAVASMSAGAKQFTFPAGLGGIIDGIEKKHGKILRHDGPQTSLEQTGEGTTTVILTYQLTCQHGSSKASLVILNENNTWHTQSFQFTL